MKTKVAVVSLACLVITVAIVARSHRNVETSLSSTSHHPAITSISAMPDDAARFVAMQHLADNWVAAGTAAQASRDFETVHSGDTLSTVLTRAGISANEAEAAITALHKIYNPRDLKPGMQISVDRAQDDDQPAHLILAGLVFQAGVERDVEVKRDHKKGPFEATSHPRSLTKVIGRSTAEINSSLFKAGVAAGTPTEVLFQMFRNFAYDVDFQRDLQPGDQFDAVYDQWTDENGHVVRTGQLRYASLTLSGKVLKIYRFETADGMVEYFNEKGSSVKKALLRTPVDGAKLTSGFGMRSHPILGYTAMHRGVDFGVASGTPVMAAGDGVVDQIGSNGGYGNYVRLHHNTQYGTAYAHLSAFAHGLHHGSVVHQGEIIAYSGSTGLSTGPHLHFEVLVNDKQINPLSVKLPTGRQLEGAELARFHHVEGDVDFMLEHWVAPETVALTATASPTEAPVDGK